MKNVSYGEIITSLVAGYIFFHILCGLVALYNGGLKRMHSARKTIQPTPSKFNSYFVYWSGYLIFGPLIALETRKILLDSLRVFVWRPQQNELVPAKFRYNLKNGVAIIVREDEYQKLLHRRQRMIDDGVLPSSSMLSMSSACIILTDTRYFRNWKDYVSGPIELLYVLQEMVAHEKSNHIFVPFNHETHRLYSDQKAELTEYWDPGDDSQYCARNLVEEQTILKYLMSPTSQKS